jgi:hypothetical protein
MEIIKSVYNILILEKNKLNDIHLIIVVNVCMHVCMYVCMYVYIYILV